MTDDVQPAESHRPEGWYPDPWGTDNDRWFDGGAWTRRIRPPGGVEPPPEGTTPTAPGTGGWKPASTPTPGMPGVGPGTRPDPASGALSGVGPGVSGDAPAPVPGWYPDPARPGWTRFWDGARWTSHAGPTQGYAEPTAAGGTSLPLSYALAEEHVSARWARAAMLWAGPAQALSIVVTAIEFRAVAAHWSEYTTTDHPKSLANIGSPTTSLLANIASIASLVAGVLFILWLYRAARVASNAGWGARRSPGLGALSFIIPVVNFWWPYRATLDALPEGHASRQLVTRWWTLWIATEVATVGVCFAAFSGVAVQALIAAIGVVTALVAAVLARGVVDAVTGAHHTILDAAASR